MIAHFAKTTTDSDDDPRERHSREEIYADRIEKILKAPKEIQIQLQTLRLGDLGIPAIPFETFAETGLALKDRSPFNQTFTIELANGSYGYLPTPQKHRLGGYETWLGSNFVEKEATTKIVATLLDLLEALQQDSTDN